MGVDAGHPDGRSTRSGLHDDGRAQTRPKLSRTLCYVGSRLHDVFFCNRQTRAPKLRLCMRFTRRQGTSQNGRADVRQSEHFQKSLHTAVFTERTVESRKNHVICRLNQPPSEICIELEQGGFMAPLLKRVAHGLRAHTAHSCFTGRPAPKHRNP